MDLAIPLELTKIPHYANQHPNLKYSEWSQFNSRVYAVPWAWGPTGLLYDTEAVTKPGSWNALWDPAFKGKVSMWDDVSMIWTAALALGYKNVYNLTRKQLKAVEAKLFAFNDQAALYYKGGGNDMEAAMKGGLVALNSWYDPSARLKTAGQHFHMIIPKEGAVGMFDSFMVSSRSDNKALAHEYINHQISPPIQREMVQVTGLAPANMETLALLDSHMIEELNLDDPDYFSRMLLWDHMPRKNLYEKVLQAVRADWKRKKTAQ